MTTRVMCQMVAFRLISRARASGLLEEFSPGGIDETYLGGTLRFLEGNREMNSLRQKEMRRFDAISVRCNCTVAGVMSHACVEGEFVATHMEITLREVRRMGREREARIQGRKGISCWGKSAPTVTNRLFSSPLCAHRA